MLRFTRLRALVIVLGVLIGGTAIANGLGAHLLVRTSAGAIVRRALTPNGIVYGDATNGVSSTAELATGQILLGTTGAAPSPVSLSAYAISHPARGVVTGNVSDLTSFTVASNDGLTYTAGQRVLLTGQTTKSQNGLYVVGTVSTGHAPLTRPADFAAGTSIPSGTIFEVSEGTIFSNTTWKITTTGGITVDTTSFDAYPKSVTEQITLSSGTFTISDVPILSGTKTNALLTRLVPSSASSTILYAPSSLTAGIVGTASITVQAQVAAGTINSSDGSTLNVTILNW